MGSIIVNFIKIFGKNVTPKSSKSFLLVELQWSLQNHRDLDIIVSSCISYL